MSESHGVNADAYLTFDLGSIERESFPFEEPQNIFSRPSAIDSFTQAYISEVGEKVQQV